MVLSLLIIGCRKLTRGIVMSHAVVVKVVVGVILGNFSGGENSVSVL